MSHIKKFNESEDLESQINSIDIDSLRVDCEIDVAQSYDWEDDSRWCECENESDWVSSYGFASEEVNEMMIDEIIRILKIENTPNNRKCIEDQI